MASLLFLSISLFFSLSSAAVVAPPPAVKQACKVTRFPDVCETSLAALKSTSPPEIIQKAIGVSSDNLHKAQEMVASILSSSTGNVNRTTASKNCKELLANSDYRLQKSAAAVSSGANKDARAWLSAGLLYQYDCWSALKYANDTGLVNGTMAFLDSLTKLSSNALSMLASYDAYGKDTAAWTPPKTERNGFWEKSFGGTVTAVKGGVPSKLTADVTVCKTGCKYKTVQEAVNAAPVVATGPKRFVIQIKAGVYQETVRIGLEKRNIVFLGDGMGKTIITGSLNVGQPGLSTYNTATVAVLGDGFMAKGLTIQNTAGPDAHQAVAFRSDSDLSVIENCEFLGNQDTLYAHSLRQFYKSCRIQGNVDFIFGNSASFFQNCTILVAPRQVKPEKGETNAVTAHGRTDPAQTTGFVIYNCLINGTAEYMQLYRANPKVHRNYLGRPWKEYSRTVFIQCNFEALIDPLGWLPWSADFALATLYYGEFENSGPGSKVSQRVPWSSTIPAKQLSSYSVQNFIQGDKWIPSN